MTVNDRAPCSYCGYERRKPQPLGPVMGLSAETERLLVCRPCQKAIRDSFAATREIRVRLQVAVEEAAFLAGTQPE